MIVKARHALEGILLIKYQAYAQLHRLCCLFECLVAVLSMYPFGASGSQAHKYGRVGSWAQRGRYHPRKGSANSGESKVDLVAEATMDSVTVLHLQSGRSQRQQ